MVSDHGRCSGDCNVDAAGLPGGSRCQPLTMCVGLFRAVWSLQTLSARFLCHVRCGFVVCGVASLNSVTSSPVHLCHVLPCHHCVCVHFRRALESEVKRCFHICHHIGLHRLPIGHFSHTGNGAELLLLIFDARPAARTQGKHTNSGKSGTGAHYVNYTSVEDYDYGDDTTVPQMPIKQTKIQLTLGLTKEKKFCTMLTMKKMIRFLRMLLWMTSLFWRQLNWMKLLFLPTRGTMSLTLK